jgi:hypothetical protein
MTSEGDDNLQCFASQCGPRSHAKRIRLRRKHFAASDYRQQQ